MICKAKKCECFEFQRKWCKNWVPEPKEKKSQKYFFKELWDSRPHVCFITGNYLGNEAKADFFFHILPKGGYPKYKFKAENIIFTRSDYHHDWHSLGRSELLEKDGRWQMVFDLYDKLKQDYGS